MKHWKKQLDNKSVLTCQKHCMEEQ